LYKIHNIMTNSLIIFSLFIGLGLIITKINKPKHVIIAITIFFALFGVVAYFLFET